MSGSLRGGPEHVGAGDTLANGLSPLDEDRAESMASEGGRSAQVRESAGPMPMAEPSLMPTARRWPWWIALSLGAVAGYFGYRRLRRAL